MTTLVSLAGLSVAYGKNVPALSDITLSIEKGERIAIIGESGSGKTTLALALAGLLPGNARISGEIVWSGQARPIPGRDYGFVFQDAGASLNPVLTIGEQIAEVLRHHRGMDWKDAYRQASALLERVRIPRPEAMLRAYPHQLSGGQRQRVGIASAIAGQPSLLIADEPTSALDMIVQAEIVALIDKLVSNHAMTLVFITHDIALASVLADRIAVLHDARLIEVGASSALLSSPQTAYTASLIANHLDLSSRPLVEADAR